MPFGLGQRTAVGIPINAMPSTAGAAIAHRRADVLVETANFWTATFHLAPGVMKSLTYRVFGMSDRFIDYGFVTNNPLLLVAKAVASTLIFF